MFFLSKFERDKLKLVRIIYYKKNGMVKMAMLYIYDNFIINLWLILNIVDHFL